MVSILLSRGSDYKERDDNLVRAHMRPVMGMEKKR